MASKTNRKEQPTETRVVVKLKEHHAADTRTLDALSRTAGVRLKPYFADEHQLRAATLAPFNRYLVVAAPDTSKAAEMAKFFQSSEAVDVAYVEGGPTEPPVDPTDDPRFGNQGYLTAAPDGIDAIWAWQFADGDGVGFVDLEQGWTLNHEDLAAANITIISGVNHAYHSHGTAVLGEVLAVDNAIGGIGIAPRASGRVVSQWQTATNWNTATAILSAGQAMSRGDVLLLEAQTSFGSYTKLPVEAEALVADAIRHVVDDGIIVIEAAGNGANDLDAFRDSANRATLDRNSNDFVETGAIMVGAGSSTAPHSRLDFSNFGNRIDCYGWGRNIDTTGPGVNEYTGTFSGTSGASPIVAGAAVLIQSWKKRQQGRRPYSPGDMRDLLSDPTLNTQSANPATDRIGVLPNLRAIFESIDHWQLNVPRYANWVYILIGLIDDSPGVIWVPGKGPVPVDPGWGRRMRTIIPSHQRDLLSAMAVDEIAKRMHDGEMRERLRGVAADSMRGAVERVAKMR